MKLQEELVPLDDETSDHSNEKHSTAAASIQGDVQVAEPLGVTSAVNEDVEISEEYHEIQTDLNDDINGIKSEPEVVEHSGQLDDEDGKIAYDNDVQVMQEGVSRTIKKDKDTPSSLRTSISMSNTKWDVENATFVHQFEVSSASQEMDQLSCNSIYDFDCFTFT